MLFPQLEEKLQASKQALNTATSENIIEQCKQHLALLAEYRIQLYKLQDLPGVQQSTPSLSGEVRIGKRFEKHFFSLVQRCVEDAWITQ